jgi:hypothetical protein
MVNGLFQVLIVRTTKGQWFLILQKMRGGVAKIINLISEQQIILNLKFSPRILNKKN